MLKQILPAALTLSLLSTALLAQTPTDAPTPPAAAASPDADALFKEVTTVRPPPLDAVKRNDPAYVQQFMADYQAYRQKRADLAARFVEKFPDDPRSADLLLSSASTERDEAKKLDIYRKVVAKYPDSNAAKMAAGPIRLADAEGKPFGPLSFTDAISGKKIDVQKDLKGKVVVIDFWATWCGPCVGEMPHMKELYAKFKDKGVEFVGVSLDAPEAEGGLTKLKEFVAKNDITWPQYYQGNGWNSDFSRSWGILSIPRVFILDAEGTLVTANARGKLEELIPQLLAKRVASAE